MAACSREEMEEMMRRWIAVNDRAEQEGNWRHLADFYTEDVRYGWDTPNGKYEFNGRDAVRDTCVGAAMDHYKGWTYPYDKIVIDETRGEAFCTWWQTPPGAPKREDGSEMKVIGASWFRYGGDYQWSEQLDMYDYTNITNLIKECVEKGILKEMPRMSSEQVKEGVTMSEAAAADLKRPPKVSGEKPGIGHMEEFSGNFARFLMRCNAECGELAEYNMAGQETVLMSGPEAQEAFLKGLDQKLSRAAAYQATVPVFGKGVIFDAPPERMKTQLKIQVDALRYQNMKSYAAIIAREVQDWVAGWGDEGELDFLDEFIRLTLNTACHCLLGADFRYKMTEEFKSLYHDLEKGLQAIAFVDPYLQQPLFEARDNARARLQELISDIIAERRANADRTYGDALETFMSGTYKDGSYLTDNEITGLVIATMFAGHHTSSGTAAWTAVELARNPQYTAEILQELEALFGQGEELTFENLREIPRLESFIEEVLRLHPPLVLLMRRVIEDIDYKGTLIESGKTVAISTYGSHRNPEYFPDPEAFDPHRARANTPEMMWAYIPFGGGPHKCAGNAFALMQLKSIFAALLPKYAFELVDPPESYQDDLSAMVLKPGSPSRLRYRKRR